MAAMTTALPNLQQLKLQQLKLRMVSAQDASMYDGEDPDRADADRTANYTSHDIEIVSNFSKLRDMNNYSILMGLDTLWL